MNVLIIGGGPAGMMAAGTAAENGHRVTLIEKNDRLGKKLRITGKGRCNLTNACPEEELIMNVVKNGRFLYSAFHSFSNASLMTFFEELGVPLKVERGNRVFPESDKASDIVDTLKKYIDFAGVKVLRGEVEKILAKDGKVCGATLKSKRIIPCDAVILATGGKSYPVTGSTGDGFKMALALGHTVTALTPSLVPLECAEKYDLMGLSLKNIGFKIAKGEKVLYEDFGEMIFTHFGISGPVVLSASAHIKDFENCFGIIDLKPALSVEELDRRLIRDFEKYAKKDFINALDDLLPKRLITPLVKLSGIFEHKKAGEISKPERLSLGKLLKNFTLTVTGFRPIEEAIITSGGISTNEINPKTMESKIIENLYFAGEIIDVNAYTGGFNLQIAFSTGHSAAMGLGKGNKV